MHKLSIHGSIFAFAGFVFAAPASSADLDRDCCADLEERVAELEAAAARRGTARSALRYRAGSTRRFSSGMKARSTGSMRERTSSSSRASDLLAKSRSTRSGRRATR